MFAFLIIGSQIGIMIYINLNNIYMDKCISTKCKLWLIDAKKKENKLINYYEKELNRLRASRQTCKNERCQRLDRLIKQKTQFIKSLKHPPKKEKNATKKMELENCKKVYCNPGCKNTIWEDGEPNKLPKGLKKQLRHKLLIDFNIRKRKDMFGTRNTVLRDGFYEGLSLSATKKMKKEGSISGCINNLSKNH